MSKDITLLTPLLRRAWTELKLWYETLFPDRELVIGFTQRTPVEQLCLFCQGRLPLEMVRKMRGDDTIADVIVTWKDGFVHPSKHNAMPLSRAMDIWVKINGTVSWDEKYYLPLGDFVRDKYFAELRYGGGWKDWPHIEEI